MSDKQKLQEDFLTCSVCLEIFREPKTLSCLHRFCEECLQNHIQTQSEVNRKGFKCPVCRQFIMSPNPKAPPSEWASLLKTDFFFKELIKFNASKLGAAANQAETALRHPCDVHPANERDLYCTDCNTAICHLCSGIAHRGCGQVVTVEEAAADRRATTDVLITNLFESCSRSSNLKELHDKGMDHFSQRKITVERAIRERVHYLKNLLKQEEMRLLENLERDFKHEQSLIATRSRQFDREIEQLINRIDSFVSAVGAASDFEILTDQKILGAMKDNQDIIRAYEVFVSSLSHIHVGFEATSISSISIGEVEITMYHETSENLPAGMNSLINDCGQTPTSETHLKKWESSDLWGNSQIKPLAKSSHKSSSDGPRDQIWNLTRSPTGREDTDRGQRQTTNTLWVPDMASTTGIVTRSPRPQSAAQLQTTITKSASASVIFTLGINDTLFADDHTIPKLRGVIVTFPDSTIIVTDWANQKIKAFFFNKEKNHGLFLPGKPWAVTQVKENLVAVSLPLLQKIGFYKIIPKLEVLTMHTTSRKYTGLVTLGTNVLAASGGNNPPRVDLINLNGKVLRSFALDSHGFPLFVYPSYLCVTPSATIVVSDMELGVVTGITHEGVIKFRFSLHGCQRQQEHEGRACDPSPNGVACDQSGRIIVSDSRGLILLSPEGQFEKTVVGLTDGILTQPWGVTVDHSGLIYVTINDHELFVLINN